MNKEQQGLVSTNRGKTPGREMKGNKKKGGTVMRHGVHGAAKVAKGGRGHCRADVLGGKTGE